MKQYQVEFRLKKGLDKKTRDRLEAKYGTEYGFGMNPPAITHAKDLDHAIKYARKVCPKDCVISSVKLDR